MNEFKSWRAYWDFQRRVKKDQRYIRSVEDEEFLKVVLETSQKRHFKLKQDELLWRAQIGHDWEYDNQIEEEIPCPFPPSRMVPLKDRAKEGRANPKGIPYLYLATQKETAMSEVRPWIGAYISCASFKIKRDLRMVNLSEYHTENLFELSYFNKEKELTAEEKEKAVWTHIDRAFSEPVTNQEDGSEYIPTQIIAELIKSDGMDGIAYKSNFGGNTGYNVMLFSLDEANLHSCQLYKVNSAEFNFIEDSNPYSLRNTD